MMPATFKVQSGIPRQAGQIEHGKFQKITTQESSQGGNVSFPSSAYKMVKSFPKLMLFLNSHPTGKPNKHKINVPLFHGYESSLVGKHGTSLK